MGTRFVLVTGWLVAARAHGRRVQPGRGLDPGREVIPRRPVAGWHNAPHHRPDAIAVEQHVDRQHEDQHEIGNLMAKWLLKEMGTKGNVIEVRGVAGNPVDLDRHKGLHELLDKEKDIKVVEVVGNWDDGTAQKAVADAIAIHGKFDGMSCQGGTTGAVRALIDAKNPFIPVAGEAENGFRKLIAEHAKDGLKGWSYGQSPALVAISLKAAIAALQGNKLPQYISAPIPYVDYASMKPGVDYFPDLSDDFFVASGFPQCGITLDAGKLMNAAKTSD